MLSPSVTTQLIRQVVGAPARRRPTSASTSRSSGSPTLTERELDVAVAVGHGKSNAEIAAELFMSVATVKAHVSRILTKLDATNRVQIAITVHDADLL